MEILNDLFFVNDDDQLEIDFDSLALITSGDFVTLIHNELDGMIIQKVVVEKSDKSIRVHVLCSAFIYYFRFNRVTGNVLFDEFYTRSIEVLGGVFNA